MADDAGASQPRRGGVLGRISSKHFHAVVQVVAGLALNIYPAIFIAIYARIAPIDTQGFLALALTVGVYVAQLVNAFIVEGRLATPDADHHLCLPTWIALISTASAALLVIGPAVANPAVLMISSIGLMSGLLVGRSIGVVSGMWRREAIAATVLIAASLLALILARQHSEQRCGCWRWEPWRPSSPGTGRGPGWPVRPCRRMSAGRPGSPRRPRLSAWSTGDDVGGSGHAGPAASVAFRVVSTVSGALEPILAYGRYRLLAHGHRGEIAIVAVSSSAGLAAVLAGAFLGLGSLIFGPAWSNVGAVALLLACLWKGFMLLSTVPFAALRKAGETALVFWIRGASTRDLPGDRYRILGHLAHQHRNIRGVRAGRAAHDHPVSLGRDQERTELRRDGAEGSPGGPARR